ncbi:ParA family protein [Pontibacter harenae]|uniref:ParA family protein n=1 Tax=Pontibacter harenae TaxID=2894083 RepID=UPI001E6200F6|nr:ParA family protein [Pontibacter harenae]
MTKVISFVNAKGGVGKTTTSVNVAGGLANEGFKTLFVDLDPQGNATSYLALEGLKNDMSDLLLETAKFEDVVVSKYGMDIIPVICDKCVGMEGRLASQTNAEMLLMIAIEDYLDNYDYVIIDCPPAIGKLTANALLFSDYYVIPVLPEPFSVDGIAGLTKFTDRIAKFNKNLKFAGFLLNKYNSKKRNSTNHIIADHIKGLNMPYFSTSIREDKTLYDVILMKGGHIFNLGNKSNGVEDFKNLCKEIVTL